jgi:hypothetical protein
MEFEIGKVYDFGLKSGKDLMGRIKSCDHNYVVFTTLRGEYWVKLEDIEFSMKYDEDPYKVKTTPQKRGRKPETKDIPEEEEIIVGDDNE